MSDKERRISWDEACRITDDMVKRHEQERREANEREAREMACVECEEKDTRIAELEEDEDWKAEMLSGAEAAASIERRRAEKAEAESVKLREALKRYGHHDPGKCAASKHSDWPCDCGLAAYTVSAAEKDGEE